MAPLPLPLGAGSRLPNWPEVIRKRFIHVVLIALYILHSSGIINSSSICNSKCIKVTVIRITVIVAMVILTVTVIVIVDIINKSNCTENCIAEHIMHRRAT